MMDEDVSQEELFSIKRDFEELLESRGWRRLMEVAQGQIQSRQAVVLLRPLEGSNAVYAQEFAKGEIGGITLFTRLPEDVVEQVTLDLEHINSRMDEAEENSDGN